MISGIIMASGFSKRMKQDKLFLTVDGIPMVEAVIAAAKASQLDEIILVYRNPKLRRLIDKWEINAVENPFPQKGQSESMKLGIQASNEMTKGYLFFVGDQPFITPAVIDSLINAYYMNLGSIIVPRYDGERGNPVLFSSHYKDKLLSIEGDRGGRSLIQEEMDQVYFLEISNPRVGIDIDNWDTYIQISHKNNDENQDT